MKQIGDDAHLAGASSTPSGPIPQVQGAAAAAVHSCRTELLLQYDRMSTNLENDPPKQGGSKKKRRGNAHECPICHQHGHHRNTCREGDPEAKEALALLAAQKKADNKRKKKEMANTEAETSDISKRQRIAPVPNQIEAPPGPTTKKRGKEKGTEKETRKIQKNGKAKGTSQATPTKAATDSPAMGTRSRKRAEESPAMGTRNKRRREDNQVMGTNTKRRLNNFL